MRIYLFRRCIRVTAGTGVLPSDLQAQTFFSAPDNDGVKGQLSRRRSKAFAARFERSFFLIV